MLNEVIPDKLYALVITKEALLIQDLEIPETQKYDDIMMKNLTVKMQILKNFNADGNSQNFLDNFFKGLSPAYRR